MVVNLYFETKSMFIMIILIDYISIYLHVHMLLLIYLII